MKIPPQMPSSAVLRRHINDYVLGKQKGININRLVYFKQLGKNNLKSLSCSFYHPCNHRVSILAIALLVKRKKVMCLGSELLHVTMLECSFVGAFVTRAALADNQKNCLHGLNIMQSKYSYTFLGRCKARTLSCFI